MDEIMVSKRLAVGILQYLGKQPVVEMYTELAALVVRAEKENQPVAVTNKQPAKKEE
jgi:hypothetical protein